MPLANNEPCFTCGILVNGWSFDCDYGCERIYCSDTCANQTDVDPINGSGIYWCPACEKEFEEKYSKL